MVGCGAKRWVDIVVALATTPPAGGGTMPGMGGHDEGGDALAATGPQGAAAGTPEGGAALVAMPQGAAVGTKPAWGNV